MKLRWMVLEAARGKPSGANPPVALQSWLAVNRASVDHVTAGPLMEIPYGISTFAPATESVPAHVFLHVFDWHASGKVIAYGLASPIKRAYLLSDPKADLPVSHDERFPIVQGPPNAPDAIDTVVVLEIAGDVKVVPVAVDSADDGTILLHAKTAVIHGRTLRYEPDPHKNTCGYWTDPADWIEWKFNVTRPGRYTVEILQGCGKGNGGSAVDVSVAGKKLPVVVQDTGHFQNFVARDIGEVNFGKAGEYTIQVRAVKKAAAAVMDLRQVTLKPAAKAEEENRAK